jgi:SulP family sulfate permease
VFFLTVVFDLTVAVEVGLVAACMTFIYRISSLSRCEKVNVAHDAAWSALAGKIDSYRLYGALFFGAVKLVEDLQDHLPQDLLVVDLRNLIYIDSSGADTLNDLARACNKNKVRLFICGLSHQPQDILTRCGFVAQVGAAHIYPLLIDGMNAAMALASLAAPASGGDAPVK